MRILQVTPFFSAVHGGSAEMPFRLTKELAEREHRLTVYTSDYQFSSEYADALPGVEVYPFKSWLSWSKFFITPGLARYASANIRHFDIIHMHNHYSFQNVVVHHYARRYNIPYVLQAHGSAATYSQRAGLKKLFNRAWGYRIIKDAAGLIAFTEIEAGQYRSLGTESNRIRIVPNGIDIDEFKELPSRGRFLSKHGLFDGQRVILYLGRIEKTKGIDLLVRAFAGLSSQVADARLVVVGPDEGYLPVLKSLVDKLGVRDRVLFTGPLYGRDKLEAYVDADVYVLPCSFEGFGLTLLESCACGTPVICSTGCGIADVIDGQVGLVVPYEEGAYRNAMLEMLGDEGMRRRFGEKGRSMVREKYNWSEIAQRVESVYSEAKSSYIIPRNNNQKMTEHD